ncbi:MAG: selenocysteine-specific translation elongation factor [Coriobacteriia bacterium]|nr:selenocysteine-specific translation elongation factor [Coriobacteriia bacterium]
MPQAGRYAGVLGTAGHIDHGKSTLIKALTGTDPDRLKEEKERGITIELGFAELDLPGGIRLGVVDVPGHEKFIRHMVAGATGVDIALLVVAADDGVMVQTREHLSILQLLGVCQLVVALTKIDRAGAELTELAAADVAALLEQTPYAGAPILPVSAVTGEGLDGLRAALAQAASELPRRDTTGVARLPIDRVFTIGGAGTVVTGTLWEGTVAAGDKLELVGPGAELRIRQIQEHGQPVDRASAGQRVALNIVGASKDEIARGMVIATPGLLHQTLCVNAQFSYLADPAHPAPLRSGTTVHLHHGTSEVLARLLVLERESAEEGSAAGALSSKRELVPGQSSFIQLRLFEPLTMRVGDRFIIRAGDPLYSIGGGVVLDTAPRLRTHLAPGEYALLQALYQGDTSQAVRLALESVAVPVTSAQLAIQLGLERSEVAVLLDQTDEGVVTRLRAGDANPETAYLSVEHADQLLACIEQALLAWHESNPQQANLASRALLDRLPVRMRPEPEFFDALLQQLAASGVVMIEAGRVAHKRAAASVQRQLGELRSRVLARLEPQGLSPESIADLQAALGAQRSLLAQALGELSRDHELVRLSGDLYFTPAALEGARTRLVEALQATPGGLGAAELRDVLGVSRKYAIPVLEYFDARGVTIREGDLRRLRSSSKSV